MSKRSTKLEALNDIFEENGIDRDAIPICDDLIRELKKNADAVPDYRHPSYIRHLVGDIVMIVFFALLGNADEWSEIESFARQKEKWLRKYLELPNGIPTDDTIRIVMGNKDKRDPGGPGTVAAAGPEGKYRDSGCDELPKRDSNNNRRGKRGLCAGIEREPAIILPGSQRIL